MSVKYHLTLHVRDMSDDEIIQSLVDCLVDDVECYAVHPAVERVLVIREEEDFEGD